MVVYSPVMQDILPDANRNRQARSDWKEKILSATCGGGGKEFLSLDDNPNM